VILLLENKLSAEERGQGFKRKVCIGGDWSLISESSIAVKPKMGGQTAGSAHNFR
jgi:hypothetical protein